VPFIDFGKGPIKKLNSDYPGNPEMKKILENMGDSKMKYHEIIMRSIATKH